MYWRLKTLPEIRKTNYIQDMFRFEAWTSHDSYVQWRTWKGGWEKELCCRKARRHEWWNSLPYMTTSLLSKQVSAMQRCALQELLYWGPWSHLFCFVIHANTLTIQSHILFTALKQKRLLMKRFSKNSVFTCLLKHVQSLFVCLSLLLGLLVSVVFFVLWTIP